MNMFFRGAENPPSKAVQSSVEADREQTVLKVAVSIFIVDGCHRQHAIKLLQEMEEFSWTVERFCKCLVMRTDETEIKAPEVIELRQVLKSFSTILCTCTFFRDTVKALINYMGALYQQYSVQFADD